MVVDSVAYRIEAVVVTNMEAVSEVDYICHAFTGYTLYFLAGEAQCQVVGYGFRYFYVRGCPESWCCYPYCIYIK